MLNALVSRLNSKRAGLALAKLTVVLCAFGHVQAAEDSSVKLAAPLYQRFAPEGDKAPSTDEVPSFQKHVSPLLGRLGCNGRACHGSFQGQGGFQLSLFGYDFTADHDALLKDKRVNLNEKLESLILTKPVSDDEHEGGKRFEPMGWEYWVLRRWIENEAPYQSKSIQRLERLEVFPPEIQFGAKGETTQIKAIACWEDGSREDVTCLCRFQSNDDAIAAINESGLVTAGEAGDSHVVVSYDNAVVPILCYRPLSDKVGSNYPNVAAKSPIDQHALQKLKKLGIVPSELCTDEEFLRRASLDATGTLPTAQEVVDFVVNTSPDKRAAKIEELLGRPGYAAQWTTFLCDMTGNNEDQLRNFLPQQVRPENQWYQWIYQRVRDNVPYDQIVEGIVTATSRLPDESYRDYCSAMTDICQDATGEKFAERPGLVYYWARNNFKTAEDRAIGFAYSFLGVRIQCAQCHKHPFDQWSKSDFDNFERLFGAVQANQNTMSADAKRESAKMIEELDVSKSLKGNQLRKELGELLKSGKTVPFPELTLTAARSKTPGNKNKKQEVAVPKAKLLGGEWIEMDEADVRGKLMTWLRAPENPYFAKAIVNRVWAQYFGAGIVNPADDLNLANAPSNAPLLEYLADGFVQNQYDFKWLHREILNSDTYQRSWIANETNALDRRNFSHSQLRRLPAEATYDAVRMALVDDAAFEKAQVLDLPRAITKAGSSAQNAGRDDLSYALSVFGRSARESNCDCDRSSEPSLLQTVFLVNDAAVQEWLSDPKTGWASSVAEKFEWEKPATKSAESPGANNEQLERMVNSFRQRQESIEKRLDMARENGKQKQVESLKTQLNELTRQAKSFARKNGLQGQLKTLLGEAEEDKVGQDSPVQAVDQRAASEKAMTEEQALWVAENAYLRTLSRKPNSQELATSVDFLKSESSPVGAVQGLLWGLINTKEFILNH